jgi:probable addiction module antidote protein
LRFAVCNNRITRGCDVRKKDARQIGATAFRVGEHFTQLPRVGPPTFCPAAIQPWAGLYNPFRIGWCYEEGSDVFLQALRDVVEAQGGMTRAARLAGLNRESLYRQLSRRGNPSFACLNAVLSALGLKLPFAAG